MTQKDLARRLHVSDRAVSKWERGAGFPDVSLLEPLAAALNLQVLDLLRGEEREAAEMTVRRAISLLLRQTRERSRRRWSQLLASAFLLAMSGFVLFGVLDYAGAFLRPVDMEMPVAVYADGRRVGESTVRIQGERRILGEKTFEGRFAIACVEKTCREAARAYIRWNALDPGGERIQYHENGAFLDAGVIPWLYISEDLGSFGCRLEDGRILATDQFYVSLLMAEYYYSLGPVVSTW